jgi:hypothetical protein
MDLRQYFKKIREAETALTDSFPLVISMETSDGGKPGMVSEVSRELAARMLVEGRAVLAEEKDRQRYFERQAAIKQAAEKAELSRRLQVAIIADPGYGNGSPVFASEPEVKSTRK